MNLKREILECIINFSQNSTIHGLQHLGSRNRHIIEKIFWGLSVLIAAYGAGSMSWSTWRRFQDNPTVISIETNFYDWNIDFPSTTICQAGPLSDQQYLQAGRIWKLATNASLDEVINFIKILEKTFLSYKKVDDTDSFKIPKLYGIKPSFYLPMILSLKHSISYSLLLNGKAFLLKTKFAGNVTQIITDRGICFTAFGSLVNLLSPKYWSKNDWSNSMIKKVSLKGNFLDGDVIASWDVITFPYQVYIINKWEIVEVGLPSLLSLGRPSYKLLPFRVLSIHSTKAVKSLNVKQRQCLMPSDKSPLQSFPVYTFGTCRMECRASLAHRMCNCHPFYFKIFKSKKIPLCGPEGLECIYKNQEVLAKLRFRNGSVVKCNCLQNCDDNYYMYGSFLDTENWLDSYHQLSWQLSEYPRQRLKRDIVFGWSDLLVGIGGTAGLFLGCSLLSFVEIIYFSFVQLFLILYEHMKIKLFTV